MLKVMKNRWVVLIALIALAAGLAIGWAGREFLVVDSCLDAGGAWRGGHCVGARDE